MRDERRSAVALRTTGHGDTLVVRVDGTLDSTTYLTVRDHIIKAALDAPAAVIVDVSGLVISSPSAWSVFTSAAWHVTCWPAVPVLLVCDHAAGREAATRNGVARRLPVHPATRSAVDALPVPALRSPRRRVRAELPPTCRSLSRSRQLVEDRLSVWSMADYVPVAKVVVTALVENVLVHTLSPPQVRLESDGHTVTVAVDDGCHSPLGLRETRDARRLCTSGLHVIDALSRRWGNAPTPHGKTVWAVMGPENRL